MIEESYVSFDTAKMLKEAGFEARCGAIVEDDGRKLYRPTQALAARWLREVHNIDISIDVYNRYYYCCNIYKNKHRMIMKDIIGPDYIEVLEAGLQEAIKLIKK